MTKYQDVFTEEVDRLIRERYDSRTGTITRMAQCLDVPRWAVTKRAQVLGVARTKEAPWTPEDEEYLAQWFHRRSIGQIAHRLGRSVTAVSLKANRLGITKTGEGYTVRGLAVAFGVDAHKVTRWIELGLLRASKRHTERERDVWYISEREVRRFITTYPGELDRRKVDLLWLIGVLATINVNGHREE